MRNLCKSKIKSKHPSRYKKCLAPKTHYIIIIGAIDWEQKLPTLKRKYPSTLTVKFVDNLVEELQSIKRVYPSTITVLSGNNINE